jgi:hypothetical protein
MHGINENLVLGTSESHTDNFVDFMLRKLKLDRYPNQENGPFSNFNYLNPSERRIIVNTLCQLSTEFHTTGAAVEETAK